MRLIIDIDKEEYEAIKHIPELYRGNIIKAIANGTPEDDFSEIVKRPKDVEWSHSPFTDDLTCPVCREVSKKNIFNNFCPNCGARMKNEVKK